MNTKYISLIGIGLIGVLFIFSSQASPSYGATVFNSNQVGSSPQNGYYLQTDGTNSTWAAVSGSGGTGNVSTSTGETAGNLAYWTSNSATPALLGKVATTTATCSGSVSCSTFTVIGSSPITLTGSAAASSLATSSPVSDSNILVYSTASGGSAYGVATSTLTATSPLTGSFVQIGSGGALGCQAASGSQAGCLSSTDWTTFNSKQAAGSYLTSVTADSPLSGSGTSGSHLVLDTSGSWTGNAGTVTNGVYTTGAGSVFEVPLTFTYPLIRTTNTISTAFGTTTAWGMGNNGLVMTGATGIPFSQATSSPIALNISGNAATVTTNANLTGAVTSSGNATTYAGTLGNTLGGTGIDSSSLTGVVKITGGTWAAVGAQTCTNQFVRAMSAAYVATCATVSLTADVTGTLPATNGGTGTATVTTGDLLYGSAANTWSKLSLGTAGYVLASTGGNIGWVSTSSITGSAAGSGTQIQYNDYGPFGASSKFTFSTTTNTLTLNGGGSGDAQTTYGATSFQWALGYKSSDNSFRISSSTALGTSDALIFDKNLKATLVNASTTGLSVSGVFYSPITSALLLADSANKTTAASTQTCTNQFVRAMSAAYAATCATVSLTADVTGTLPVGNGGTGVTTFGGTNHILYTTSADTLASEAEFTYDSTANRLTADYASSTAMSFSSSLVGTRATFSGALSPIRNLSLQTGTTTAWTATTSGAYIPTTVMPFAGTIRNARCTTDTGTLNVDIYHTSTHLTMISASTTVGTFLFTANNTFTAGEKLYMAAGTPASTPTSLSCTLGVTETP